MAVATNENAALPIVPTDEEVAIWNALAEKGYVAEHSLGLPRSY